MGMRLCDSTCRSKSLCTDSFNQTNHLQECTGSMTCKGQLNLIPRLLRVCECVWESRETGTHAQKCMEKTNLVNVFLNSHMARSSIEAVHVYSKWKNWFLIFYRYL